MKTLPELRALQSKTLDLLDQINAEIQVRLKDYDTAQPAPEGPPVVPVLSLGQFQRKILLRLKYMEQSTATRLSKALNRHPSQVLGALKRLIKYGYVQRTGNTYSLTLASAPLVNDLAELNVARGCKGTEHANKLHQLRRRGIGPAEET